MVQTEKVWEVANEQSLPRIVVLNRLDRDRASLDRSLASLREACGRTIVPLQLPIGEERAFRGIVDTRHPQGLRLRRRWLGHFSEAAIPST